MNYSIKTVFLAVFFASTVAYADTLPRIAYGSIMTDANGKRYVDLNEGQYSVSKKQPLCWVTENVFSDKSDVAITENFLSPPHTKFQKTNVWSTSNDNETEHTVFYSQNNNGSGQYYVCWSFNQEDPEGKYQIQVKIDNIVFPPYQFNLKH